MNKGEPLVYSMKAAVAACGGAVSRTAIYEAGRKGFLVLRKRGKRTFVLRTELMAWLLAGGTFSESIADAATEMGGKRLEAARAARQKKKEGVRCGPEYVKTPAAAKLMGIGTRTLEAMRDRNEGPPFMRIGARSYLYKRDDLHHWLKQRQVVGDSVAKVAIAGGAVSPQEQKVISNTFVTDDMVERGWKTSLSRDIPKWRIREILEAGLGQIAVPQYR